ncbi:MAG: hypothetical protein BWX70_02386 [Verrucomicrobia bacterium ADurb.Bin070]|nr:MAG: hypothetical protein BWX70_02386 [Verrucomicrobia bacterium ADurb.Bin070]
MSPFVTGALIASVPDAGTWIVAGVTTDCKASVPASREACPTNGE